MESKEMIEHRITAEYEEYKKWAGIAERSDNLDGEAVRQRILFEGFMNRALEKYAVFDLSSIPVAEKLPSNIVLGRE